jgi:hypothetical protein
MQNVKEEFKKRAADLKEEVSKNKTAEEESGEIYINEKLCPFRGDAKHQVACTQQCKIHRPEKKGFECMFSELASISWSLKDRNKYKK